MSLVPKFPRRRLGRLSLFLFVTLVLCFTFRSAPFKNKQSSARGWNLLRPIPSRYLPSTLNASLKSSGRQLTTLELAVKASAWIKANNHTIPNTRIPKIIHQTWKYHDLMGFNTPSHVRKSAKLWMSKHPDYVYLLWDDKDALELMINFFPQYLNIYQSLPRPVMRADIFRYLVLLQFGGVYADLDVFCLRNINSWVESQDLQPWNYKSENGQNRLMDYSKEQVSFIAGLEMDLRFDDDDLDYNILQLAQWTMASAPDHAVLLNVVNFGVSSISSIPSMSLISDHDVIQITGPKPWTRAIQNVWKDQGLNVNTLRNWGPKSRQIKDQLILPIPAFSPGCSPSNYLGGGSISDPIARVQHIWSSSWRGKSGLDGIKDIIYHWVGYFFYV